MHQSARARLAEIFLNTEKNGTALDVAARDAAISASLLLQHGCPAETLRRALCALKCLAVPRISPLVRLLHRG